MSRRSTEDGAGAEARLVVVRGYAEFRFHVFVLRYVSERDRTRQARPLTAIRQVSTAHARRSGTGRHALSVWAGVGQKLSIDVYTRANLRFECFLSMTT